MKCADLTNDVSFHDSTLERVEQENDQIVLYLDTVAAHLSYIGQDSVDEYVVLDHVRLACEAARTRKLEFWADTKAPVDHPEPEHPIVEIMENDLKEDVLEISGFGPSSGWVVWQIEAGRFSLQWSGETRYKKPKAEQDSGGQQATRAEST
jgi:hypothetical protein